MVNTYRKGLRVERKVIEYLAREGYIVARVEKLNKFSKTKDLFGLFDIIAINEKDIRLIQVTTQRPHLHEPYIEFAKKYPNLTIEQYIYKGRNIFIVYTYPNLMKRTIYIMSNIQSPLFAQQG